MSRPFVLYVMTQCVFFFGIRRYNMWHVCTLQRWVHEKEFLSGVI